MDMGSRQHAQFMHVQSSGVAQGQRRLCIPSTSWNSHSLHVVYSVLRGSIADKDGCCISFTEFYYLLLHRCFRTPFWEKSSVRSQGPSAGMHVIYEEYCPIVPGADGLPSSAPNNYQEFGTCRPSGEVVGGGWSGRFPAMIWIPGPAASPHVNVECQGPPYEHDP